MKKIILITGIFLTLLPIISCKKDIEIEEINIIETVENESFIIPINQALDDLYDFLNCTGLNDSKSGSSSRQIKEISYITSKTLEMGCDDSKGDEGIDTLLYLINFSEEKGFAVLAADRRLSSPILAVSDSGDLSPLDFSQAEIEDMLDGDEDLSNFIFYNEDDDDYYVGSLQGSSIIPKMIADYATDEMVKIKNQTFSHDVVAYANTTVTLDSISPLLETDWHQDSPFNDRSPKRKGTRAPAGCVAIALAQIMAYHEYPKTVYYDGVQCDWKEIKKNKYSQKSPIISQKGYTQVGYLLRKIGYYSDMLYFRKFSFATPAAAKRCLTSFGYQNVQKHTGYHESVILNMLKANNPVFIAAISGTVNGHAWVIDGYKIRKKAGRTYTLLHCNWGWRGLCNGYYYSGIFDLNKKATEVQEDKKGSNDRNYDHWYRIISYDNPNK